MLKQIRLFVIKNKFLLLVVVLAATLRLVWLDKVPPSLNWDEVSHGYNAFSILKTGKDEWGVVLPIIFRAYGDYKLPIYIYFTVFSEFLFGLSMLSVRLPSVLAGIGTVVFTYFLTKELFKKDSQPATRDTLPLVAGFLVAIEPWSFFLSRAAFEANLALFFFIAGMYFFSRFITKFTTFNLLLTILFFGLSVWTYNSYRIFTSLTVLTLIVIYKKEIFSVFKNNKKYTAYVLLLSVIFFVPMFIQLLNPIGQARYSNLAILDSGAINQINDQRNNSNYSPLISHLLYNKPSYFASKFISNYISHFSPTFLFLRGGKDYQFSVPGFGVIYPINALFIFLGIIFLVRKRSKLSILIFSWLMLAPIPDSLTRESPHVLRSITTLPLPMILSAIGLCSLTSNKTLHNNLRFLIVGGYLLILFSLAENYFLSYFNTYQSSYSWSWQYGYNEVVNYLKSNYSKYDKIIITKKYGEPHEFMLFNWPWNPAKYQHDSNLIRFYQSNWYWVDGFDKFYFINDWDIAKYSNNGFTLESKIFVDCSPTRLQCLLVTSPDNHPDGWQKLDSINFLDNKPAFEIYEN